MARTRAQRGLPTPLALVLSLLILAIPLRDFIEAMSSNLGGYGAVDYDLYMGATRRWLDGGSFYEPYQLSGPYPITAGDILYPPFSDPENQHEGAQKDRHGVLLYIKPCLIQGIPEDIRQYAKFNPNFPHQDTSDQFFDEAQFESYRHLGKFLMDHVYESVGKQTTPGGVSWNWE